MNTLWIKKGFLTLATFLIIGTTWQVMASTTSSTCSTGSDADIVLMLDGSGSMASFSTDVKDSAKAFLDTLIANGSTHSVAIGSFGSDATINAPLSTDYTNLQTIIDGLFIGSLGGTEVTEALSVSQTELLTGANTTKIIILLSDGIPNNATTAITEAMTIKTAGTRIITIGFNLSDSSDATARSFLATIATDTASDDHQDDDGDGDLSISDNEKNAENNDGDDFYIAPDAITLDAILTTIGLTISCDDGDPCTQDTCNEATNSCEYQAIEGEGCGEEEEPNDEKDTNDCNSCEDDDADCCGSCGCCGSSISVTATASTGSTSTSINISVNMTNETSTADATVDDGSSDTATQDMVAVTVTEQTDNQQPDTGEAATETENNTSGCSFNQNATTPSSLILGIFITLLTIAGYFLRKTIQNKELS